MRKPVMSLLLVSVLAACGGGSLTNTQYVARLNAMCEDFAAREQVIGEPKTLPDVAAHGEQIAAAFDAAFGGIHDLDPPRETAADAGRLRRLTEEQSSVLHRLAAAAQSDDLNGASSLSAKNAELNYEATAIARRIGARSCT